MDGSYCQCMIGPVAGAFIIQDSFLQRLGAIPVNVLFVAIILKNFGLKGNVCFKMLK
jgi:hypothetical protein